VVVLENYLPPGAYGETEGGHRATLGAIKIAKYARGKDYHRVLRERLDRLGDFLKQQGASVAHSYADGGPVPERELAQRAGLGWIGKNAMLIRPGVGSFVFIGTIFTDLPLAPSPSFDTDRCGTCTRCLEACPTDAFVEPRVLDATRCIAYLTIEYKGSIPEDVVPKLDGWAFGCDICNDVCPWNQRFATPTRESAYRDDNALPDGDEAFFERMDEMEFQERFAATPLERAGLTGMRRNLEAAYTSLSTPARRTDAEERHVDSLAMTSPTSDG
jgi:epoxyqueuosine reductase